MLISKIYNKLDEESKNIFVGSLIAGLIWGVVISLIAGLIWGVVISLIAGLIWGVVIWGVVVSLIAGLIAGLIWGVVIWGVVVSLIAGLVIILVNFKEAYPFLNGFYPILILIFALVFISEILFWLMDKEKVKKKNIFKHTLKRKSECIFETLLGFSLISQIYILIREIQLKQYLPVIIKWIGYLGIGLICLIGIIFIFYIWIKLNTIKYRIK